MPSFQVLLEIGRRLGVSADYLASGKESTLGDDPLFSAELAARLGDRAEARAAYQAIITESVSPFLIARARVGLGLLAFESGDHESAIQLLEAGLLDAKAGPGTAVAADRLGRAYALTGRFAEALALFSRYLSAARERGDHLDSVRFSVLLANTHIDRGDYRTAETVLSEVLDEAAGAADPTDHAFIYWTQSRLHSAQNEPELAGRFARLALASLEQTEHTGYVAKAFILLAALENDQGRPQEARALVERAEPIVRGAGNRYDIGVLDLERARAELGLGNHEEAASRVLGSLPLLANSNPTNAGRSYALAASVFRELGDTERALELYELAAETFPIDDRHAAEAYSAMAEIAEASGRKDDAIAYLKRAVAAHTPVRATTA